MTSEPGYWPAGWAAADFGEFPTVYDDEDFELSITVLDADGSEIAMLEQTRNFDVDRCRCLSFPYRLDGTTIERAD